MIHDPRTQMVHRRLTPALSHSTRPATVVASVKVLHSGQRDFATLDAGSGGCVPSAKYMYLGGCICLPKADLKECTVIQC